MALHGRAADGGACCRYYPTRRNGAGKLRPSAGSMGSWISEKRPPASVPPPWCWIAPPPLTNASAKQWHRCRQRRSLRTAARPPWPWQTAWNLKPLTIPARAAITAVHGYVPPDVLTNAELARMVDTTDAWIVERTGIKERHILHGEGLGTLAHGRGSRAWPARQDQDQTGRHRTSDLRHHDAGFRASRAPPI